MTGVFYGFYLDLTFSRRYRSTLSHQEARSYIVVASSSVFAVATRTHDSEISMGGRWPRFVRERGNLRYSTETYRLKKKKREREKRSLSSFPSIYANIRRATENERIVIPFPQST